MHKIFLNRILISVIAMTLWGVDVKTQNLEIIGHARITEMDTDNSETDIVVRLQDGTLAQRAVSTIKSKTYQIGEFAHGGIVFWVDETGEHGLVCTISDQSSSVRWSAGNNYSTMVRGNGPLAGKSNTSIIISSQGEGDGSTYAARICNELFTLDIFNRGVSYNHGDWYLPSREELTLIEMNREIIDNTTDVLSAFGGKNLDGFYWSSTENDSNTAWSRGIGDLSSGEGNTPKHLTRKVRAVRAF